MFYKGNTLYNAIKSWNIYFVDTKSLPKRHFAKGARKLVGFRLPDELKKQIESLASELGWTITDVAQTALDAYVHEELLKIDTQKLRKLQQEEAANENSKKRSKITSKRT